MAGIQHTVLLMQFMFGVGGYIVARVLAILLPLFFVNQPGQEDLAIRIVLILENIVLWGFLAALAYIFRSGTTSSSLASSLALTSMMYCLI